MIGTMSRRTFAILSEYRARELGLLSPDGELDPDALPAIPDDPALPRFEDDAEAGGPLPFAAAAEIAWAAGWLRAVAVQTGGDPGDVGEAWLVRSLPDGGVRPERIAPRTDAEVEAAAAAWRADGRAREAAAEAIRRRRLEAMAAESRAESEALAGGSALALAGAL